MKFEVAFPESLENQLKQMGNIDGLAQDMLTAAAPAAVDAIKMQVERHRRTGDLGRSVKAGKPKKRTSGGYYLKVDFRGKDDNGVPNAIKAAGLEYGNKHGEAAQPFMKAAENSCKEACAVRMQDVFDKAVEAK